MLYANALQWHPSKCCAMWSGETGRQGDCHSSERLQWFIEIKWHRHTENTRAHTHRGSEIGCTCKTVTWMLYPLILFAICSHLNFKQSDSWREHKVKIMLHWSRRGWSMNKYNTRTHSTDNARGIESTHPACSTFGCCCFHLNENLHALCTRTIEISV